MEIIIMSMWHGARCCVLCENGQNIVPAHTNKDISQLRCSQKGLDQEKQFIVSILNF